MFCAKCGQPVPEGAKFCAHCGAAIAGSTSMPSGNTGGSPSTPSGSTGESLPAYGPRLDPPPGAPAYGAGEVPRAAPAANTLVSRLVARVKGILVTPKAEWPVIAGEATTASNVYLSYIVPLVAIAAIASFIGAALVGIPVPLLGTVRIDVGAALAGAILHFVLTLVIVFVVALIVDALAPTFGGQKDALRALKVTAYSFTPAWVAAVLTIFPALGAIAALLGLYGLYLLYLGLPVLMRSPADKSLGYTVVIVISAIVLSIVITVVTGLTLSAFGLHAPGTATTASGSAASAAAAEVLSKALGGKSDADRARVGDALSTLQKMGEAAERAEHAAKASGKEPGAAAANAIDVDKALAAVGQMMSGGKQVEPVDFRALRELLPASLAGMARTNASGERGEALGMKGSSASAEYVDGAHAHITVEIADLGSLSGLASIASRFEPVTEKETDTSYERTRKVDGHVVREKYDRRTRTGETSVLIENRFSITARGSGIDDKALAAAVRSVDTAKLTRLAGR